ncbi:ATPase P [bacterium]|nr:MAG: ATPase P [bacterium]
MLEVDIPGFGRVKIHHLVSDFTGTLSVDGKLLPGVKERLKEIAKILSVHILTADTFGMAEAELRGIPCVVHILTGKDHDVQKRMYVETLGAEHVAAFGNGKNDREMLQTVRIGIAVTEDEGCAVDALTAADIHVNNAVDGLDLILKPKRCKATLRF